MGVRVSWWAPVLWANRRSRAFCRLGHPFVSLRPKRRLWSRSGRQRVAFPGTPDLSRHPISPVWCWSLSRCRYPRSLRRSSGRPARGVSCAIRSTTPTAAISTIRRRQPGILADCGFHRWTSPALAQRLRQELEQQFGPDYEAWLEQLGERRRELFGIEMDPEIRRAQRHEMASARAFQEFVRGPVPSESPVAVNGTVYLVGAGPGDPELLTLKALRILGQADVVLHDDLLTEEILELVPSTARLERVGKRHGQRQMTQEDINARLCAYAAQGLVVVRLKGGDGTIFGRAGEEIGALRAAQVPFSIVPGVTSASSAAAAAGVSLTDRRSGSVLAFVTAQRCRGNPAVNWKAIAALWIGGDLYARRAPGRAGPRAGGGGSPSRIALRDRLARLTRRRADRPNHAGWPVRCSRIRAGDLAHKRGRGWEAGDHQCSIKT